MIRLDVDGISAHLGRDCLSSVSDSWSYGPTGSFNWTTSEYNNSFKYSQGARMDDPRVHQVRNFEDMRASWWATPEFPVNDTN